MGTPSAPNATGAVLARSERPCGLEGGKAEADENASADGYGSSEAAGALKECAECEGDEEKLQAAVRGDSDETLLQEREPSSAHGELVEEEERKDDPANREESVADAVAGCEKGQAERHVEDDECDG